MRILIDECLNWRLSRALTGHYCVSVQRQGWSGVKNGDLLTLAEQNQFDVFLTGDRNLMFQQPYNAVSHCRGGARSPWHSIAPNAAAYAQGAGATFPASARTSGAGWTMSRFSATRFRISNSRGLH